MFPSFSIIQNFDSRQGFLSSIDKEVAYHQRLYKTTPEDWQMFLISAIPNDNKSGVSMEHSIT